MDTEEVPVYIEVLCKYRSRFIDFLESRSIQCRPFYPNLNQASYFNNFNKYPNSELFADQGVYLPAGPVQPIENIYRVIEVIKEFGSLCA